MPLNKLAIGYLTEFSRWFFVNVDILFHYYFIDEITSECVTSFLAFLKCVCWCGMLIYIHTHISCLHSKNYFIVTIKYCILLITIYFSWDFQITYNVSKVFVGVQKDTGLQQHIWTWFLALLFHSFVTMDNLFTHSSAYSTVKRGC